jgi:hypothetical protein
VTRFDPGNIFNTDPNIATTPPPERPANVADAVGRLADRIAKQPNQLTTGIVAEYQDHGPRQQALKNETGKTLRNVTGILVVRSGADQSERWIPVNFAEWKLDPTMPMAVVAADNPTKMRLMFEAEIEGGGPVGFDQRLPDPPPPKKQQ